MNSILVQISRYFFVFVTNRLSNSCEKRKEKVLSWASKGR